MGQDRKLKIYVDISFYIIYNNIRENKKNREGHRQNVVELTYDPYVAAFLKKALCKIAPDCGSL